MKPKTIIITVLVLGIIGYLLVLSFQKSSSTAASIQGVETGEKKSILSADELSRDLGVISMKNGLVPTEFALTNPGTENVTINKIITSCMCTTAFIVGSDGQSKGPFGMPGHGGPTSSVSEVIKPGENRTIRVVYDPNAHGPAGVGPIERFVLISDLDGGSVQLAIKAVVTP